MEYTQCFVFQIGMYLERTLEELLTQLDSSDLLGTL